MKDFFLKINCVSNLKLQNFDLYSRLNKTKIVFNKRLFYFLFFVHYVYKDTFFFFKKIIYFCKPKKVKKFNILRAPYKNKLAQNSYTYSRYFFSLTLKFSLNRIAKDNYISFVKFICPMTVTTFSTNINNVKNIQVACDFNYKI